jgi:hypothetical protein
MRLESYPRISGYGTMKPSLKTVHPARDAKGSLWTETMPAAGQAARDMIGYAATHQGDFNVRTPKTLYALFTALVLLVAACSPKATSSVNEMGEFTTQLLSVQ